MGVFRSTFRSRLLGNTTSGPTIIRFSSEHSVLEGTVADVIVGTLSVNEPGIWTFSLVSNAGGRLAISGSDVKTTSTPFDYDTATSYDIRYRAERASDGKSVEQVYTLAVIDTSLPAGVISSGTQVAHNTRATAGLKTTPLYTVAANAAMFPAGTNISSGPNQLMFPETGADFALADFDFTGYEVSFRGANARLDRCLFANNGGGRLLVTEGTSEVTVYDTTFDGTGMQNVHQAIVVCGGGTKLTEYDCSHIKSPKCHVDSWGQYRATRSWYGAFGWNPGVDPHQEGIFFRQGTGHQLTDCGFDISEFDSPSGETGIWYLEGEYNPTSLVATGCTMYGALANDVAYPIQLAAKNYAVSLTLIDFAVQSGPSGYVGVTEVGGNKVTVVAVNTFEYTSGAAVDLDRPRLD